MICGKCLDIEAEAIRMAGEIARLKALNESLAAAILVASEVLGKLAVRFMAVLEEIATDDNGSATVADARRAAADAVGIKLPNRKAGGA